MGALGGSGPCGCAEAYYYDFLDDRDGANIPPSVIDHIQSCDYCRKRIRRLEQTLSEVEQEGQQDINDNELIAELQHHFEYLGKCVECKDVKPFLPSLLSPSLRIKVPTPISSHVDRCSQCARDLRALSALHLRPEQLSRLKNLYGASFETDSQMCQKAREKINAFGLGMFDDMDTKVLDHLCLCPTCRDQVYRHRKTMLRQDGHDCPGSLSHGGISMAEVFDYVVPYGRNVNNAETNEVCQGHIQSCPECLEMIQLLHRTVYDIAERADSDIRTVYSVNRGLEGLGDHSETFQGAELSADLLSLDDTASVVVISKKRGSNKRKFLSHSSYKSYVKIGFVAAAMIPLVVCLHLMAPFAFGLNLGQVNETVVQAPSVHVEIYTRGGTRQNQEFWYARDRKILIERIGQKKIVYDWAQKQKMIIPLKGEPSKPIPLNKAELDGFEKSLGLKLGVSLQSRLLKTELKLQFPKLGNDSIGETEIFEMTSESFSYGLMSTPRKWLVYIDPEKQRPTKIETYSKSFIDQIPQSGAESKEGTWRLEAVRDFSYPSEKEIIEWAKSLTSLE